MKTELDNFLEEATEAPTARPLEMSGTFVLPNDHVRWGEAARVIFAVIAPTHTIFSRGKAIVELTDDGNGLVLGIIRPEAFRSRLERYDRTLGAWKLDVDGKLVFKPKSCSVDTAIGLLNTIEAGEMLPCVNLLANAPVAIEEDGKVRVLGKGYHAEAGGLLVVSGDLPPEVPLQDAVKALNELLEDFLFQTDGDKARALAAFITPALKMGGLVRGATPADVAEADVSQSGKTYRQKIVRAIYREAAYFIAPRTGGVGSLDESISAGILSGRPFIAIDNLRGALHSQFLEGIMTWGGKVNVRVPYAGETAVDTTRVTFQLTSNGVETTRDFANRSSIVRIRKRIGHTFRSYPEGDLLAHVEARQPFYLGCVIAIIREWVRLGKLSTGDTRHDFREWAGVLDWICQTILQTAPLLDGHQAAQERTSNPALTWLRRVALLATIKHTPMDDLSASNLYEICEEEGIEIPNLRKADETNGRQAIGRLLSKCFGERNEIEVDHLRVRRVEREVHNSERQEFQQVKRYQFSTLTPPTPPTPPTEKHFGK